MVTSYHGSEQATLLLGETDISYKPPGNFDTWVGQDPTNPSNGPLPIAGIDYDNPRIISFDRNSFDFAIRERLSGEVPKDGSPVNDSFQVMTDGPLTLTIEPDAFLLEKVGDPIDVRLLVSAGSASDDFGKIYSGRTEITYQLQGGGGGGNLISLDHLPGDPGSGKTRDVTLHLAIGQTLEISANMSGHGVVPPGGGGFLQSIFSVSGELRPASAKPDLADLALTSATTDDARSVNLNYSVSGGDLSQPFQVAVYRSDNPDPKSFDINTAIPVGSPVTIPATDSNGASSTAEGTHVITVNLDDEISVDSTHTHPYLFVVANPPGNGHVPEADDSNDRNDVAALGTITAAQLQAIMPNSHADAFVAALNSAMGEWAIITPKRQAAFLGQLAVESKQLNRWNELYTTKANFHLPGSSKPAHTASNAQDYFNYWYAGVNGNGNYDSGDGYAFRGRGPIQLTARNNYTNAASALGDPTILTNPDQVGDSLNPLLGLRVAGWFWQSHGLNQIADSLQSNQPFLFLIGPAPVPHNFQVVMTITKRVNGGYNALLERVNYTSQALLVLNNQLTIPAPELH